MALFVDPKNPHDDITNPSMAAYTPGDLKRMGREAYHRLQHGYDTVDDDWEEWAPAFSSEWEPPPPSTLGVRPVGWGMSETGVIPGREDVYTKASSELGMTRHHVDLALKHAGVDWSASQDILGNTLLEYATARASGVGLGDPTKLHQQYGEMSPSVGFYSTVARHTIMGRWRHESEPATAGAREYAVGGHHFAPIETVRAIPGVVQTPEGAYEFGARKSQVFKALRLGTKTFQAFYSGLGQPQYSQITAGGAAVPELVQPVQSWVSLSRTTPEGASWRDPQHFGVASRPITHNIPIPEGIDPSIAAGQTFGPGARFSPYAGGETLQVPAHYGAATVTHAGVTTRMVGEGDREREQRILNLQMEAALPQSAMVAGKFPGVKGGDIAMPGLQERWGTPYFINDVRELYGLGATVASVASPEWQQKIWDREISGYGLEEARGFRDYAMSNLTERWGQTPSMYQLDDPIVQAKREAGMLKEAPYTGAVPQGAGAFYEKSIGLELPLGAQFQSGWRWRKQRLGPEDTEMIGRQHPQLASFYEQFGRERYADATQVGRAVLAQQGQTTAFQSVGLQDIMGMMPDITLAREEMMAGMGLEPGTKPYARELGRATMLAIGGAIGDRGITLNVPGAESPLNLPNPAALLRYMGSAEMGGRLGSAPFNMSTLLQSMIGAQRGSYMPISQLTGEEAAAGAPSSPGEVRRMVEMQQRALAENIVSSGSTKYPGLSELTASESFRKTMLGAHTMGGRWGQQVAPGEELPAERWAAGPDVLRNLMLTRGGTGPEVDALVRDVMSGDVEGPRALAMRYPFLAESQAGAVLSYMSPAEYTEQGYGTMKEYMGKYSSTVGLSRAVGQLGGGDWDVDPHAMIMASMYEMSEGGFSPTHFARASTAEDIRAIAERHPAQEVQSEIAKVEAGSTISGIRETLEGMTSQMSEEQLADLFAESTAIRGGTGSIYNIFKRGMERRIPGRDPMSTRAREEGSGLALTAIDIQGQSGGLRQTLAMATRGSLATQGYYDPNVDMFRQVGGTPMEWLMESIKGVSGMTELSPRSRSAHLLRPGIDRGASRAITRAMRGGDVLGAYRAVAPLLTDPETGKISAELMSELSPTPGYIYEQASRRGENVAGEVVETMSGGFRAYMGGDPEAVGAAGRGTETSGLIAALGRGNIPLEQAFAALGAETLPGMQSQIARASEMLGYTPFSTKGWESVGTSVPGAVRRTASGYTERTTAGGAVIRERVEPALSQRKADQLAQWASEQGIDISGRDLTSAEIADFEAFAAGGGGGGKTPPPVDVASPEDSERERALRDWQRKAGIIQDPSRSDPPLRGRDEPRPDIVYSPSGEAIPTSDRQAVISEADPRTSARFRAEDAMTNMLRSEGGGYFSLSPEGHIRGQINRPPTEEETMAAGAALSGMGGVWSEKFEAAMASGVLPQKLASATRSLSGFARTWERGRGELESEDFGKYDIDSDMLTRLREAGGRMQPVLTAQQLGMGDPALNQQILSFLSGAGTGEIAKTLGIGKSMARQISGLDQVAGLQDITNIPHAGAALGERVMEWMPQLTQGAATWGAGGAENLGALQQQTVSLAQQLQGYGIGAPGGWSRAQAGTYRSALGTLQANVKTLAGTEFAVGPEVAQFAQAAGIAEDVFRKGTVREDTGIAVEENARALQDHTRYLEDNLRVFKDLVPTIEDMAESGKALTGEQRARYDLARHMSGRFAAAGAAGVQPGALPREEMYRLEQAGLRMDQAGRMRRAGVGEGEGGIADRLYRRFGDRQAMREGVSPGQIAQQGFRRVFSGWELMRLRRMWGLTGGVAMGAMPIAAQAEQGAMQAGMVSAPTGQWALGGITSDLMQTQAQQQQFQIQMGTAANRAWGWMPQMMADTGLGTAAGIGLPAAGLGLAAGWGAGVLGLGAAAAPLALGVAGVSAAYGAMNYAREFSTDEPARAVAFSREVEGAFGGGFPMAGTSDISVGTRTRRVTDWLGKNITSRIPGVETGRLTLEDTLAELGPEQRELYETGMRVRSGELEGLPIEYRTKAVQEAYQYAPQWMTPTAAQELGAQWMRYTPGATDLREIYEDPRFEAMAARGMNPERFVQMGQQIGMRPEQWQETMNVMNVVSEQQMGPTVATAQQWQGLRAWGVSPQDILRRSALGQMGGTSAMAGKMQGVFQQAGLADLFPGVTGAMGELMGAGAPLEQLPGDPVTQQMWANLQGMATQQGILGLEQLDLPEDMQDAAGIQQVMQSGQVQLGQQQIGLYNQMTQMGWNPQDVSRATGMAREYGAGGMRAVSGFLQGDRGILNMIGQANVGDFAQLGDTGLQMNVAQIKASVMDTMSELIPPDMFEEWSGAVDDLRSTVDDFGHQMGERQMFAGYDEGYLAQFAPSTVDPERYAALEQLTLEEGRGGLRRRQLAEQQGYEDFQFGQAQDRLALQGVAQFGGQFTSRYSGATLDTRGTFAIQQELRNLSRIWEDFTSDFGQQQQQLGYRQFMENWQVRADRLPQRFEWQRADLAFQGQQSSIQFGWQMEDIQENLRFATGRDRRRLLRQQERAAVSFGMGMGRLDEMGGRIDTSQRWAEEDLEREKRHFEERFALQDDYQNRYRRYVQERRRLEDELQVIREFQARFSIDAAEEQLQRQRELQEELRAINERYNSIVVAMQDVVAAQNTIVQATSWFASQFNTGGDVRGAWDGFISHVVATLNQAMTEIDVPQP